MTLSQCIWPIQGRFAYRRAGGKATFLPPNRCDSAHNLLGLPGPDPGHFLLVQKVTKNTHRGGTLSMGSLPYEPHPHDDTKGACPLWIPPQDLRLSSFPSDTPEDALQEKYFGKQQKKHLSL